MVSSLGLATTTLLLMNHSLVSGDNLYHERFLVVDFCVFFPALLRSSLKSNLYYSIALATLTPPHILNPKKSSFVFPLY